ncbi:tubulin delta chain-like [Amphiura filiformis]|uniref:tubulin delta chain-like n=1 Tax=Amphiura filiformis TaxID=82378 RepID=UPI003B212C6B
MMSYMNCLYLCFRSTFLTPDKKLRSVHIDTEKKVLKKVVKQHKKSIRECNVVSGKQGRGCNWAMGYNGPNNLAQAKLPDQVLESLRKEVERCDCYSGTVMMHSIAGGTGAGLGSRLVELIRDEYPLAYILSAVVAPWTSGESPLQHYNSLFSLSWLQRYSDGVLMFSNDEILHRLSGLNVNKRDRETANVTIDDMNKYIAESLAGVMLPVNSLTPKSGVCIGNEPWEMLRSVCPMPAYKFVQIGHTSKSDVTWEALASTHTHKLCRYDTDGNPFSSISTLAVVRGDSTGTFPRSIKSVESKITSAYNCVKWNPFPVDFWISSRNINSHPGTSSITVCANSSSIVEYTESVFKRAQDMFQAKAYLHWYQRYGCDETTFLESFETLNGVINEYKEAVS